MARAQKTEDVTTDESTESTRPKMVSAGVSPELHEAIETHRWANRMSKANVVEEALREWATKRGLLSGETGE